ncbi:MAG: hypothetical protein HC926_03505 [Synechococcaceae cyanobacterium SM2_3_60]|nr:hypothetical protein [Synechococcaceae cyanobacterium SM2_3_60]
MTPDNESNESDPCDDLGSVEDHRETTDNESVVTQAAERLQGAGFQVWQAMCTLDVGQYACENESAPSSHLLKSLGSMLGQQCLALDAVRQELRDIHALLLSVSQIETVYDEGKDE